MKKIILALLCLGSFNLCFADDNLVSIKDLEAIQEKVEEQFKEDLPGTNFLNYEKWILFGLDETSQAYDKSAMVFLYESNFLVRQYFMIYNPNNGQRGEYEIVYNETRSKEDCGCCHFEKPSSPEQKLTVHCGSKTCSVLQPQSPDELKEYIDLLDFSTQWYYTYD